jgi:hypothetical protein
MLSKLQGRAEARDTVGALMVRNIIEIGTVLYGPRFQRELSDALGVNERTMRRWVAGSAEPPASLTNDLLRLVLARRATLDKIITRLQ